MKSFQSSQYRVEVVLDVMFYIVRRSDGYVSRSFYGLTAKERYSKLRGQYKLHAENFNVTCAGEQFSIKIEQAAG